MMIKADFHMHTSHSFDCDTSMEDMCTAAVSAGLDAVAITDHADITQELSPDLDTTVSGSFIEAGLAAQRFAGTLRIARGIELGQALHNRSVAERILNQYCFDFVLCSLHNLIDGLDFYYYDMYAIPDNLLIEKLGLYFEGVLELAKWGRFHSLAHLTYPFRYIPEERIPKYSRWSDVIDQIFHTLAYNGLALEINTSTLFKPYGKTMPDFTLIRRFRELGGELITIGCDAHNINSIGRGLSDGETLATLAGFRYAAVYFDGQPEMRRLD